MRMNSRIIILTIFLFYSIGISQDKGTKSMVKEELGVAVLGGGCFWCVEAVFELVEGVHKVVSGYTGGDTADPTYEEVCSGSTGHAEAIQVTFDTAKLKYKTILEIFFAYHDPTTINRQGNDIGTQYRSAIYYHDKDQKNIVYIFIIVFRL